MKRGDLIRKLEQMGCVHSAHGGHGDDTDTRKESSYVNS